MSERSSHHPFESVNKQFVESFARGDDAGVAAVYREDAQLLPPGGPKIKGRGQIQAFWREAMRSGVRAVELRTVELQIERDTAYEIGAATLHVRPEGGEGSTISAKYVVVWKRGDEGDWKWAIDIWNQDA
jgi:uncharacterized protein (TIGR02246 family)